MSGGRPARRLTIADDHVIWISPAPSGCSRKGINVPLNYATAYSVFALRCMIGPDIPNNAGSLAPFTSARRRAAS
jgi:N-methylhydantoinase B